MSGSHNRQNTKKRKKITQEPSVNTTQINGGKSENNSFFGKVMIDETFSNN